ncbi:MAG: ATP-binding protein, partial [Sedimenticola sp.]|nr:ATP-binding protein [Sedimenticola sp.]
RAFNLMAASLHRSSREIEMEHRKRTDAERLACVGEMAASIAHEIRNPMVALINSVKLLGNEQLSAEDHKAVSDIVNTESNRLQRILNDFLMFSRLPEAKLEQGDLSVLVDQTIGLISQDPRYAIGICFEREYKDSTTCLFDSDLMRQVLINLMLNAMQAISGEGKLTIRLQQLNGRMNVSIMDNGRGIPAEVMPEITKPFFTSRKEGTGMGLPVVQRILAQHGTVLIITSREGTGTEVAFDLEVVSNG